MKLLSYLQCPRCRGALVKKRAILRCGRCKANYEIRQGIPVLIDLTKLPVHLQKQVIYFEKEDAGRTDFTLEPWQKRYIEAFLKYGKPNKDDVIVDNATGSGYMAIGLAQKGFRVIATDLTLKELVKLKRAVSILKLADRVGMVCCNSEVLPIKTGKAGGLVANAILEHLPRERHAIDEIRRVTKKGAPVMVAMPLAFWYIWPFLWPVNFIHDKNIGHLRRYTKGRIIDRFKGFREVVTYYTGHLGKVTTLGLYVVTKQRRWLDIGEMLDTHFRFIPYGASNVVSVLRKI